MFIGKVAVGDRVLMIYGGKEVEGKLASFVYGDLCMVVTDEGRRVVRTMDELRRLSSKPILATIAEHDDGYFVRTAIVMSKHSTSLDVLWPDGTVLCQINLFVDDDEKRWADVDVILPDDSPLNGRFLAWRGGQSVVSLPVPGGKVLAVDLRPDQGQRGFVAKTLMSNMEVGS